MSELTVVSETRSFGGRQRTYAHYSEQTKCTMRFAAYLPPGADGSSAGLPALFWLSGLTCTEENFTVKAGAQRLAAELGLVLVCPDTSPRGPGVPDDAAGDYDFGLGAGFYVDALLAPWSTHYRMRSYVADELFAIVARALPVDCNRIGISGHSMGGHGALTLALTYPDKFRSVTAFAPIASPIRSPWGRKAFTHYLGPDERGWRAYDACVLLDDGARVQEILVDQGANDQFLHEQLKPHHLVDACERAGVPIRLRLQPEYDHSYFFVASYIDDHLRWHKERLTELG